MRKPSVASRCTTVLLRGIGRYRPGARTGRARAKHSTRVALGDLYRITGRTRDAEAHYALVEKLHRDNADADHMHLAQFYADHDRNLDEALRIVEEEKSTRNIFDAAIVARVYYESDQSREAKRALDRALRLGTPDARILFTAGMIYAKLGDRGAAQRYLHRAVSLNPSCSPLLGPR